MTTNRLDQEVFDQRQGVRVSKRISEAIGYIELGLEAKALECLERLGPLGPLAPQVNQVRFEALRRYQARHPEQIPQLQQPEEPSTQNRPPVVVFVIQIILQGNNEGDDGDEEEPNPWDR